MEFVRFSDQSRSASVQSLNKKSAHIDNQMDG